MQRTVKPKIMWISKLSSDMEPEPLDPLAVRFRRYTKIWQLATIVACIIAVVMTVLFIWMAARPSGAASSSSSCPPNKPTKVLPCPKMPSLLALPTPLPKKLMDALKTIDGHLKFLSVKSENKTAISANILYHDAIIFKGHYGSKFYEGTSTPDDNTKYRIGSVTKIFAVILVYKLYEDGLITSLDDPLSKYAPNFRINNPFTGANITLRQIIGQMSGLPREAPCVYSCTNTNSTEQLDLLAKRNLVMEPWTQPTYSNLGYALLGRLLTENILKTTFEEWTIKEVLQPLGMVNSGFKVTDKVQEDMALPYTQQGTVFPFMKLGWADPAGGMYSTVDDLMKLSVILTNPAEKGIVRGKILKQETIREMLLPEFLTRDGMWLWGSPWEMRFIKHFVARQKGGNIDSYGAVFSVIPELHLAVNVFVNNIYAFPVSGGGICFDIADFIHGTFIPALNETLFDLRSKASFPVDAKPFLGIYLVSRVLPLTHKVFSYTLEVKQDGDRLVAISKVKPAQLNFVMKYIDEPLLFQAETTSAMEGSCFLSHLGVYGMVKFNAPDAQGLSRGFSAPCWKMTAKRVGDSSQVALPSEDKQEDAFPFSPLTWDFTSL